MPSYNIFGPLSELVEAITTSINEIGSANLMQDKKRYIIESTDMKPLKGQNFKEKKEEIKEENSQSELGYKKTEDYQVVEEQSNLSIQFNENNIREAFVYSEIFGKPKSKRKKGGDSLWNLKF